MSTVNIARAWKDDDYFLSLSDAERALVPDNPAGLIELNDEDLSEVGGGTLITVTWFGCSWDFCGTFNSCITYCPIMSNITVCPITFAGEM